MYIPVYIVHIGRFEMSVHELGLFTAYPEPLFRLTWLLLLLYSLHDNTWFVSLTRRARIPGSAAPCFFKKNKH